MIVGETRIKEILFSDFLNLFDEIKKGTYQTNIFFITIGKIKELGHKILSLVDPTDENSTPLFLIATDPNVSEKINSLQDKQGFLRVVFRAEREEDNVNLILINIELITNFEQLKQAYFKIVKLEEEMLSR